MRRAAYFLASVAALLAVGSCGLIPESSFTLAPESRLPKWTSLPPGLTRQDVTLDVDYFAVPRATFKARLTTRGGRTLEVVKGTLSEVTSASVYPNYPLYEVAEAHGVVDIVEHRALNPTVYMTDDPSIWAKLVGRQGRR